jgi:hypothetical protein
MRIFPERPADEGAAAIWALTIRGDPDLTEEEAEAIIRHSAEPHPATCEAFLRTSGSDVQWGRA